MIRDYTDHAANERTFLAWVRTGIAIIAFGFVIEKFNLFLATIASSAVGDAVYRLKLEKLSGPFGRYEGLALMFTGVVVVILATIRFVRTTRLLEDRQMHSAKSVRAEMILSAVLVVLVASYTAYVAFG
jgi:putative membrane protein